MQENEKKPCQEEVHNNNTTVRSLNFKGIRVRFLFLFLRPTIVVATTNVKHVEHSYIVQRAVHNNGCRRDLKFCFPGASISRGHNKWKRNAKQFDNIYFYKLKRPNLTFSRNSFDRTCFRSTNPLRRDISLLSRARLWSCSDGVYADSERIGPARHAPTWLTARGKTLNISTISRIS